MFLSFQKLSPTYIISLTSQAAWANKFHCRVQPPLQLTSAFIEKQCWTAQAILQNHPQSGSGLCTQHQLVSLGRQIQVYMSDSLSEESAFILLSWALIQNLFPGYSSQYCILLFPPPSLSCPVHPTAQQEASARLIPSLRRSFILS